MRTSIGLLVVVAVAGCKSKERSPFFKDEGSAVAVGSAGSAGSAGAAGSAQPEPVATGSAPAGSAAAPDPLASEPEPPMSSDVLPSDEAHADTRVVVGDGYLFQYPASFKRVPHAGGVAYSGTVNGFAEPGTLTFWATGEPFSGTLEDLVTRETTAAASGGAKPPDVGPVMIVVGKDVRDGYAKRLTLEFTDRLELRTLVVHEGKAYILHCETPNVANAWANVGSDCIGRSTTLHIAPPKDVKPASSIVAVAGGAPPPETENVSFMMSKVVGPGRAKADVNPWLDKLAPYLKPCIADVKPGLLSTISFDLLPDGSAAKPAVTQSSDTQPETPAGASVVSCVGTALARAHIDGKAKGKVRVSAVFLTNEK